MNKIQKHPISGMGFGFVSAELLPSQQNEFYLRDLYWKDRTYRPLSSFEIEILKKNNNTSDHWENIQVTDGFNPEQVKACHFYGKNRIGRTDACYLEFHDFQQPVGLYNSTIVSCDLGDNVVISNVQYLSHYQIDDEVIIVNVGEMSTTSYSKFGNGIVKEGESENVRIWMEICNENGGRSVLPFDGMLPGDAYLWSRHRNDQELMDAFKKFTEKKFDSKRGYYGRVGTRTVIKNCSIIKDVQIGTDAYLKGANKIKNVTINSSAEANSQIGEGSELVNGIIGYGCRVFYGVKAVRFVLASHSTLKYGARLINSYLGSNSTVSCCEVLNSLIFSAHEQHHNDSFLCASTIGGQSNIAAGATIGSNHNSRSPDGELVAGRGFWPGLSVSLRHNSKFASFTLLSKGTYVYELDQPFPFALVINDEHENCLKIMPGYWMMYNLYALARNAWKYLDRDKRIDRTQHIEYDYLAPDTMNEMYEAIHLFREAVGFSEAIHLNKAVSKEEAIRRGKDILENKEEIKFPVYAKVENSKRKNVILKTEEAYHLFKKMISYHVARCIVEVSQKDLINDASEWETLFSSGEIEKWVNAGGQLLRNSQLENFKNNIREGKISSWDEVHQFYIETAKSYPVEKLKHAVAVWKEVSGMGKVTASDIEKCLNDSVDTFQWIAEGIESSRKKDYINPFRKMIYENEEEMNKVLGSLEDNSFIKNTWKEVEEYKKAIESLVQVAIVR